jgi:hypothetical protein
LAFTSSGRTTIDPLWAIKDDVGGTYRGSVNKKKKSWRRSLKKPVSLPL